MVLNELVSRYEYIVSNVVLKYNDDIKSNYRINVDDLTSVGYLYLIQALRKDRSDELWLYNYVSKGVGMYIINNRFDVSFDYSDYILYYRINKYIEIFNSKHGKFPCSEDIIKKFNIDYDQYLKIINMDNYNFDFIEHKDINTLACDCSSDIFDNFVVDDVNYKKLLCYMRKHLNDYEYFVFYNFFVFDKDISFISSLLMVSSITIQKLVYNLYKIIKCGRYKESSIDDFISVIPPDVDVLAKNIFMKDNLSEIEFNVYMKSHSYSYEQLFKMYNFSKSEFNRILISIKRRNFMFNSDSQIKKNIICQYNGKKLFKSI